MSGVSHADKNLPSKEIPPRPKIEVVNALPATETCLICITEVFKVRRNVIGLPKRQRSRGSGEEKQHFGFVKKLQSWPGNQGAWHERKLHALQFMERQAGVASLLDCKKLQVWPLTSGHTSFSPCTGSQPIVATSWIGLPEGINQ
ncbi:MAG: hypothetical protein SNJ84_03435 [Verrucomicrobiia bacterium]